jgi:hypothetical protein
LKRWVVVMSSCDVATPLKHKPLWSTEALLSGFEPQTGANNILDTSEEAISGFFDRNIEPRAEIIEGLIREAQIVAFAGPFCVGKSPFLADLTIHILNGTAWCGREVQKRPVVVFDFESSGPTYKRNIKNISHRFGVPEPLVPNDLEVYLENDDPKEPSTAQLLSALESKKIEERFKLIEDALERKPDAFVILDPMEMLFRIDTSKKQHILWLYSKLRRLLSKFPKAAMLLTFNLRKRDKKAASQPDLLASPRDWLEEVCGTLDILNRSDVRLGMDFYNDDIRVINGIRRGEDMHPILIRPVEIKDVGLAGFELCQADKLDISLAMTPTQKKHWDKMPKEFYFDDVADKVVPRASLSRLLKFAKSLGIIAGHNKLYKKLD